MVRQNLYIPGQIMPWSTSCCITGDLPRALYRQYKDPPGSSNHWHCGCKKPGHWKGPCNVKNTTTNPHNQAWYLLRVSLPGSFSIPAGYPGDLRRPDPD